MADVTDGGVTSPPDNAGSAGLDEFCGLMTVCTTKSFALLSVSYPFPMFTSEPVPDNDAAVDVEDALRSRLVVLEMAGATVPSYPLAVPVPTRSTTLPPVGFATINAVIELHKATFRLL